MNWMDFIFDALKVCLGGATSIPGQYKSDDNNQAKCF